MPAADREVPPIEWPTVLLCLVIYGGWVALTWFWQALPPPYRVACIRHCGGRNDRANFTIILYG